MIPESPDGVALPPYHLEADSAYCRVEVLEHPEGWAGRAFRAAAPAVPVLTCWHADPRGLIAEFVRLGVLRPRVPVHPLVLAEVVL